MTTVIRYKADNIETANDEQAADLINQTSGRFKSNLKAQIAATYAIQGIEKFGLGMVEENINPYLTILMESGAKFDFRKALYFAELIMEGEQA